MQVTHVQDHVSHVVIGGGKTQDFGISESAEFFNILSSTLYKDQILAVVRETLCNAWDAHIEAGITNTPIQISIANNQLIIRDFGKGIHHDDMKIIYGTYGNSTKKNDGTQTGGFGLGCKSPFAYVDTFEVNSYHEGVRSLYTMFKSASSSTGKPGITLIAQFPSSETGLSVTVNLKANDVENFKSKVTHIVRMGEINAELNGEVLPKLGFHSDNYSFAMLSDSFHASLPRLLVRYGNVVYPIDSVPEYENEYKEVYNFFCNKVTGRAFSVIFQAPPHSIAVTPSRESLSMQAHTVKTIKKLLTDFIAEKDANFDKSLRTEEVALIDKAVQEKVTYVLFSNSKTACLFNRIFTGFSPVTLEWKDIAYRSLYNNKTNINSKNHFKTKLTKMLQAGLVDKGLATSYLKAMERNELDWVKKTLLSKLFVKFNTLSDKGGFFIHCFNGTYRYTRSHKNRLSYNLIKVEHFDEVDHAGQFPFLQKYVVITNSRASLQNDLNAWSEKNPQVNLEVVPVYTFTRTKENITAVRGLLKNSGWNVIDLVKDIVPAVRNPVRVTKSKEKGLFPVSNLFRYGYFAAGAKDISDVNNRIEDFEYVYKVSASDEGIPGINKKLLKVFMSLFGHKGGIVRTDIQEAAWIAKGKKNFYEYVGDSVAALINKSPTLSDYLVNRINEDLISKAHLSISSAGYWGLKDIIKIKEIQKEFNIDVPPILGAEDQAIWDLFQGILLPMYLKHSLALETLQTKVDVPLPKGCVDVINGLNKHSRIIRNIEVGSLLGHAAPPQRAIFIKFLIDTLKS